MSQEATPTPLVDSSAFYDEAVYQRELNVIFRRTWLFVGHESMIPNPGDFITTYMADDAVIVCRDKESNVRVLLNKCRHRGNKVCQFDKGNANIFRCSYHGWSYNTDGQLRHVPLGESAYGALFDKDNMSLVSPRVATHKGLIFACWDPASPSLSDYLGELALVSRQFSAGQRPAGSAGRTGPASLLDPSQLEVVGGELRWRPIPFRRDPRIGHRSGERRAAVSHQFLD